MSDMPIPPGIAECLKEARSALVALEYAVDEFARGEGERTDHDSIAAEKTRKAEVEIERLEGKLDDKRAEINDLRGRLEESNKKLKKQQEHFESLGDRINDPDKDGQGSIAQAMALSATPWVGPTHGGSVQKGSTRNVGGKSEARSRSHSRSGRGSPRRSRSRSRGRSGRRSRRRSPSDGNDSRSRLGEDSEGGGRSQSRDPPWRGRNSRGKPIHVKGGASKDVTLCIPYVMGKCVKAMACENRHPDEENCRLAMEALRRKVCKWGTECKRHDCVFQHDGPPVHSRSGGNKVASSAERRPPVGSHGAGGAASYNIAPSVGGGNHGVGGGGGGSAQAKLCRYGADCRRGDCYFRHP